MQVRRAETAQHAAAEARTEYQQEEEAETHEEYDEEEPAVAVGQHKQRGQSELVHHVDYSMDDVICIYAQLASDRV